MVNDLHGSFLGSVERKERARLKTVKFNAKPGSFDSKGVSAFMKAALWPFILPHSFDES